MVDSVMMHSRFVLARWSGLARLENLLGGKVMAPRCSHCQKG
ncbi:hypothetical protein P378_04835 [Desulforamulus profundi]|uniref:Uncharacterized protein n=1 Tax=Desulforamulus profundi TaxID=1383067 RepID=A0A2C6L3N7_9FIRM|nr:hypothetical protein [Desulforamulus profundi]PHJ39271.1 hypothetical protein P378_04835 [Desulforamulus profundi]